MHGKLIRKSPIIALANEYVVDSPSPINISYFWSFGSLLGLNLIIMIITGVTLAMHYTPHVDLAFNSVEHIMRDVNHGWLLRYIHANGASFFFIFVYLHIGRGLFYGSYRSPRTLLWVIGIIIFVIMMGLFFGLNWYAYILGYPVTSYIYSDILSIYTFTLIRDLFLDNLGFYSTASYFDNVLIAIVLPFSKSRTRAINRIGPHSKEVLDQIIWGMLGDWWADRIPSKKRYSYRFQIEQDYKHKEYMDWLTKWFYEKGYSVSSSPKTNIRKDGRRYIRLTLFTYSSFNWIYNAFYKDVVGSQGKIIRIKQVPSWIGEYLTPASLAGLIMQDGSRQKGQGVSIATNSFTYDECVHIANLLTSTFDLKTSVVKAGYPGQWKVTIWKESMPKLIKLLKPHMVGNMIRKIRLE